MFERLCFKTGKFEAVFPFEQTIKTVSCINSTRNGGTY